MRITLHAIFGALFFLAGVVALIHPNFIMTGHRTEATMEGRTTITVTHKVISVPRVASGTEVVLGIALMFFGSRKPRVS
ncbi:MAG TPA: hypothetical protein VMH00_03910 [Candidatus Limnocylindrales bacterium]|nr:hypothetical protein [Candidatus Limnocylindrales bacterium]